MATTLKTKNSVTTTVVPTTLAQGELAVNITDKKMWVGNAATTPVQILGAGVTNDAGGSNTQVQYNSSGVLAGSANLIFNGTGLSVGGAAIAGTFAVGTASYTQQGPTAQVNATSLPILNNAGIFNIGCTNSAAADVGGSLGFTANGGVNGYSTGSISGRRESATSSNYASYMAFATTVGNSAITEKMRITSDGYIGIGTVSPPSKLSVKQSANSTTGGLQLIRSDNSNYTAIYMGGDDLYLQNTANGGQIFYTNNTERMRIDSSGVVLVGTTTAPLYGKFQAYASADNNASFVADGGFNPILVWNKGTSNQPFIEFGSGSSYVSRGSITTNGTTTAYNVASDRRLKENIIPFNSGLSTITALKPSQYNYISDKDIIYQGFIADELQSVVPHAVTGEANAVDKDGKPVYQGVDASFLIPHLVAAIQELNAKITALENK